MLLARRSLPQARRAVLAQPVRALSQQSDPKSETKSMDMLDRLADVAFMGDLFRGVSFERVQPSPGLWIDDA